LLASVLGVMLLYFIRNWKVATKLTLVFVLFVTGYLLQLTYKLNVFKEFPLFANIYEGFGTSRNAVFFAFPFLVIGSLYEYWKFSSKHWQWFLGLCFIALLLESSEIGCHGFLRFAFTHQHAFVAFNHRNEATFKMDGTQYTFFGNISLSSLCYPIGNRIFTAKDVRIFYA
jgi:hypothetical protein